MTDDERLACDECGRRCPEADVKTVQMRVPGKASEFVPQKNRLCRMCRDKKNGKWRYWR